MFRCPHMQKVCLKEKSFNMLVLELLSPQIRKQRAPDLSYLIQV